MTDEFKFREPWININLCGTEFRVELCSETAEICKEILNEAKCRLSRLKSGVFESDVSENGICQFLKTSTDRLLGIGAVDKVFAGRRQELCDLADLMCFVVSKIRDGFWKDEDMINTTETLSK
jgi:hypothetical protein